MQEQLTMSRTKGHHLTAIERGKIAALHARGVSNRAISRLLGVSHQTVANELQRGTVDQVKQINGRRYYHQEYLPDAAQTRYEVLRRKCHRSRKLRQCADFLAYFTKHFKEDGWAPDVAVGRAKCEGLYLPDEMVCTATLYNYIDAQLLEIRNINLTDKSRRRTHHKALAKHKRTLGRSIEERPKSVEDRHEFGHYELDTIVGKRNGQESVIMTFIERKSRFQLMRLIDGRDADSVNHAMRGIVAEYGNTIKSVTADNGSEFADLNCVLCKTAPVYYAHPYRSCERGTNEVHNKYVRRDFPSGQSLDAVSPREVAAVEAKLNRLPRRLLNYQTTEEVFLAESHSMGVS